MGPLGHRQAALPLMPMVGLAANLALAFSVEQVTAATHLQFANAGPTFPSAARRDVRVSLVEEMPSRAMNLLAVSVWPITVGVPPALDVLLKRTWLKMRRVHAGAVSAEVVESQVFGYWADEDAVHGSMGCLLAATEGRYAVATSLPCPYPVPTTRLLTALDLRKQAG